MSTTGNPNLLREVNTGLVWSALKAERTATKLRLAQLTGLSTVTVGAALDQMVADGEAAEAAMVPSNGGRPARSYRFHAGHRHGLALYIRGETLFLRVADLYGVCVCREEERLSDRGVEGLLETVRRMLARYPTVGAIGLGLPGVEREGVITVSDCPSLTGAHLTERFSEMFGLPVSVENDVNLAVLGYCGRGSTGEDETVAYVYFPQDGGPGAGLSLGGRLCKGAHNGAGELRCLPPGVDWEDLDWDDFEKVCDVLAVVAESYACILDPERIVFHGPGLTEAHREAIIWNCEQALETGFLPKLCLSRDFDGDYEAGAVLHTLNLLERKDGRRVWPLFF